MSITQPGILAPVPRSARYLTFRAQGDGGSLLRQIREFVDGDSVVAGFGPSLIQELGATIPDLHEFPAYPDAKVEVPATSASLWFWLRGKDPGHLLHQTRDLHKALGDACIPETSIDAFRYGPGLDLTGYEDGTENPTGNAAVEAGVVEASGKGLDGSSFVAVQQWVHDLDRFDDMPGEDQDNTIGRRISDNEELDDAPESAHVKRTAQESFDPEAFVLRRSMPWAGTDGEGLVFVAFGKSFQAFEAQLRNMIGLEDGIVDALFNFSRPVSGSYFWCPPLEGGHLDYTALGL